MSGDILGPMSVWVDETGEHRVEEMSKEQLIGALRKMQNFYEQRYVTTLYLTTDEDWDE